MTTESSFYRNYPAKVRRIEAVVRKVIGREVKKGIDDSKVRVGIDVSELKAKVILNLENRKLKLRDDLSLSIREKSSSLPRMIANGRATVISIEAMNDQDQVEIILDSKEMVSDEKDPISIEVAPDTLSVDDQFFIEVSQANQT